MLSPNTCISGNLTNTSPFLYVCSAHCTCICSEKMFDTRESVCVRVSERERVCVCVCVFEKERERREVIYESTNLQVSFTH